jgi:hypothetical protein
MFLFVLIHPEGDKMQGNTSAMTLKTLPIHFKFSLPEDGSERVKTCWRLYNKNTTMCNIHISVFHLFKKAVN